MENSYTHTVLCNQHTTNNIANTLRRRKILGFFFHFRLINKHFFLPKCTWKERLFVTFNKTQSWLKRITLFFFYPATDVRTRQGIQSLTQYLQRYQNPIFFFPTSMDYTLFNTQVIRIHSMWQYRRPDHAHPFMTQEHVLTIGTETQTQLFPQTE